MVRILDANAVEDLIDDAAVLQSIRKLFLLDQGDRDIGYGRIDMVHPRGWLRSLPAYVASMDLLGFKVLHRTEGVGMRYTIYVHRLGTGELVGILDALAITNLRTGAVSALATDHLATRSVDVAAIVGTGPVARGQLRLIELVRPAGEIRVYARTPHNRKRFITEMASHVSGRLVEAATLEHALDGAQVVTMATKATVPVFTEQHLRPGVHVNSVGPASRDRIEVDPEVFGSFERVVCDSTGLVLDEAGDAYRAVSNHGFESARAEELSSVVTGKAPGRVSLDEKTLFKSVGTGAQDLAVAADILDAAEARDVGVVVDDVNSVKPTSPGG